MTFTKLSLEGEATLREVSLLLDLLGGLERLLVGRESATQGTGLLAAEVLRHVLVAAKSLTELSLLGLVVHGQHAGDRLADKADLGELRSGTTGHLGDTELSANNTLVFCATFAVLSA